MKKVLCLIAACLLTLSAAVPALALEQSDDYYVTDETGVLSQDTVDEVSSVGRTLEADYGGCVVVAFIDYFGDTYADEYTVDLFNDWSLSDRSMLLCVSPKEGRGGMTVGSELTDVFTEDDINNTLDKYFWKEFDKGNYDKAVTKLVGKLSGWYEDYYGPVSSGGAVPAPVPEQSGASSGGSSMSFFWIVFVILLVLIIVLAIGSDRRRFRGYYASMGMPIPRYMPWFIFTPRPYRRYRTPPPPPPPGPRGGGYRYNSPSYRPPSRSGGSSGGSFGGRGGRGGGGGSGGNHSGGNHSGGGRSGGSYGGRR